MSRRYLTLDEVHARYAGAYSKWTLRERARLGLIPNRVWPGGNRILFDAADLDAFDDGATELEHVTLKASAKGMRPGRLVRPRRDRRAA